MTTHELPLIGSNEGTLALAGDWHGNWLWAAYCIETIARTGARSVFQVGDFGIWPGLRGIEYLNNLSTVLDEHGMKVYVTLGNHEDYDQVDAHDKDEQGIAWVRPNIAVLPRVYGFIHQGVKFLSLGGAPSIDFEYRTEGRDWWPQEMISDEDVALAISMSEELDGVDVMLAHDAPDNGTYAVQKILDSNPQGWSKTALTYAATGRNRMNDAVYNIKPSLFVHGHYHAFDYGYLKYSDDEIPGQILSLGADGTGQNLALLHMDDLFNPDISFGEYELSFRKLAQ